MIRPLVHYFRYFIFKIRMARMSSRKKKKPEITTYSHLMGAQKVKNFRKKKARQIKKAETDKKLKLKKKNEAQLKIKLKFREKRRKNKKN